ncbi:MAG: diguanylate cyclase [Sulfuricella sp.]|nr:diguanylate cyclase [Sulfuricella sp.]
MRFVLHPAVWLMSRLTFPCKLALVGALFLIPLVLLLALLVPKLDAQIGVSERELVGIQAIQPIKNLTSRIQAHRGMAQLALSGDASARARLAEFESQADESVRKLDEFERRHSEQLSIMRQLLEVKARWRYVREQALARPGEQSFLLHTGFVHYLNNFLMEVADTSGLTLEAELVPYYIAQIAIVQLPNLAEDLGQARALSASAVQRKALTPEERYRLSTLVGEIRNAGNDLLGQTEKVLAAAPSLTALQQPLQDVTGGALAFAAEVQNEVLLSPAIEAEGQALFDAGTLAIDADYRMCNMTMPILERLIQDRLDRLKTEKRLILTVTGLALALAAYLFLGFTDGILKNLAALKEAAGRFAKGDFHAYATLDSRDELQAIATSFNGMTDSVRTMVKRLQASEEKHRLNATVFEHTAESILITDAQRTIVTVNRAFTTLTGYQPEEVVGKTPSLLKSGRHPPEFYRQMWISLIEKGEWQGEIWDRRKDGKIFPAWLTLSAARDETGRTIHYVGIFSDISAIKESQSRIEFMATHDILTGLPNRSLLYDRIHQAIAHASRQREPFALMFIDLDNFKAINDTFGHDLGDHLLQEVSKRINGCMRAEDTLARLGGDEFTAVISGADRASAAATAQRIVEALSAPFSLDGNETRVTASIGISLHTLDGADRHTLMKCADAAMYRAKEAGKNAFHFYSEP